MRKNKDWFSILIGMWLTILIILSAYVILAYMMPFMKWIKWIENTSWAYYQSYSWIEKALYFTNKERANLRTETGSVLLLWQVKWSTYRTFSSGWVIPQALYGNSEYNKNFNIISQTEPLQLQVGNGFITDWGNFRFTFQVPEDLKKSFSLSLWTGAIVNWMISSDNDTLISSGTYITASDVNSTSKWDIQNKMWANLEWASSTFRNFYNAHCLNTNSCILKMSVVNNLILTDTNTTQIPYLEYKIEFWNTSYLPDRYTRIESFWKAYDFQKKLDVRVPQQTVNQAFDFTVFQ